MSPGSISSLLICRFMLSIRQFDSATASATLPGAASQLREHMESRVLNFAARPSDSLTSFITSFAHPVHIDPALFETDMDGTMGDASERRDSDETAPFSETESSYQSPVYDRTSVVVDRST